MIKKQPSIQRRLILACMVVAVSFVAAACIRGTSQVDTPSPNVPGGTVAVIDSDIIISKPVSSSTIQSPVTVAGRTRIAQDELQIRVKDAQQRIIATSSAPIASGVTAWATYSVDVAFPIPSTIDGFVEVYAENLEDGSEYGVIEVPVRFAEYELATVEVFFSNVEEDPNLLSCDVVYPVDRSVARPDQQILSALAGLIAGPTEAEQKQGFISSIPEEGVEVESISLEEGVLTVDFNQALQEGVAGSCRVQAIRAQITQTLLQFDGVDEVVITIDGESEAILQP